MKPLSPEWTWQATGVNGGRIIGSCKTPEELGEMIVKLAQHPDTENVLIGKLRRDYNPMLSSDQMLEIINSKGMN